MQWYAEAEARGWYAQRKETGLSQQHSDINLYKKGCTTAIHVHCDLIWTPIQQHLAMCFT